ncbi:MAG: radical SAM protein [Candidatus Omnitrophota bacterium]|nr:radical SAM protein [Candidatus Omnitrophota bacterium]
MKILLCNLPIRDKASEFPPVACTVLYNVLKRAGYNNSTFYDIDVKRPSAEELNRFFKEERFDIVGISAVVSTGYSYTKFLSETIKKASPETQVILGGNLAAAYEVVLRKCAVDVCVIGRGEKTLLKLIKHYELNGNFYPHKQLFNIEGIAFLDRDGKCIYTGCQDSLDEGCEEQPDYEVLEKFSEIDNYIVDPLSRYDFAYDHRAHILHRCGKKAATIFTSKGCINRCTFCHRWLKGYHLLPVEKVTTAIKKLMERYNVGFFFIEDECFGENKEWLEDFMKAVKPLDVLFVVSGARVSLVKKDPTVIRRLKDAGLTAIYFGIESGSEKILKIMEKNANRSENLEAMKMCVKAGIYSVIQLVIGMPGENDQTINETIEFVKNVTVDCPNSTLSVNYLQALPGTPSFDFLRLRGLLGNSIEDEERYLIKISNKDATEFDQYVNVSEEPLSKVKLWKPRIAFGNDIHWLKHHGWKFPENSDRKFFRKSSVKISLFSRLVSILLPGMLLLRVIDIMGDSFWKTLLIRYRLRMYGFKKSFLIALGLMKENDRALFRITEDKSLRKILNLK